MHKALQMKRKVNPGRAAADVSGLETTFKELGVDWIEGPYRGIGMPKSSTAEQRKQMDGFMKERVKIYTEGAKRMGLAK